MEGWWKVSVSRAAATQSSFSFLFTSIKMNPDKASKNSVVAVLRKPTDVATLHKLAAKAGVRESVGQHVGQHIHSHILIGL